MINPILSKGEGPNLQFITLRDYFAGCFLAGIMANPVSDGDPHEYSKYAYELADAMLLERAKPKQ
jgi:hypothetical protein